MVDRELFRIIRWENGQPVERESLGTRSVSTALDPTGLKRLAISLGGHYFRRVPVGIA